LHSLTEWTFRQTHIFLNFNILVGTLASLCYAKRQARRQLVEAERFDELPDFEFSQAVTRNAQPCV
jgi:hypothetical protein